MKAKTKRHHELVKSKADDIVEHLSAFLEDNGLSDFKIHSIALKQKVSADPEDDCIHFIENGKMCTKCPGKPKDCG